MERKGAPNPTTPPLPPHGAFVVHFHPPSRWRPFAGRAEHLSSGTFVHFGSLRALLHFFAEFFDAPDGPAP